MPKLNAFMSAMFSLALSLIRLRGEKERASQCNVHAQSHPGRQLRALRVALRAGTASKCQYVNAPEPRMWQICGFQFGETFSPRKAV